MSPTPMDDRAHDLLRLVVAVIIAVHGWARLFNDAVAPFGTWLDSLGFPLGPAWAWAVTLIEIVGTPLLLARRAVLPLVALYVTIYSTGIVLVHAQHGWFVVGLGRNGVEFSVLLIGALLAIGLRDLSRRRWW